MSIVSKLNQLRERRKRRVRTKLLARNRGQRKRVYLKISNRYLYAQLIDDASHKTLLSMGTAGPNLHEKGKIAKNKEAAKKLGQSFASGISKLNLGEDSSFIFDRGDKLYHGRVQVFAETLRENGIKI